MGRIVADPAALREQASRIDRVRSDLDSSRYVFTDAYGGLQSRVIEHALDEFSNRWSDKRADLVTQLGEAAMLLRTAADQFESADTQLADALTQPAGDKA